MNGLALRNRLFIGGAMVGLLVLTMGCAHAQAPAVPHALVASPDFYKVIAENDKYRVIVATWKPGQRDKMHSHPDSAVYYPMDCMLRAYGGNGELIGARLALAGTSVVLIPIPAHAIENAGTAPCKVVMFEPK